MIPITDMTPCDAFRKPTGHILTKKTSLVVLGKQIITMTTLCNNFNWKIHDLEKN